MLPQSRKQWIFAFDVAVLDLLARRSDVAEPNAYHVEAQPCPKHGRDCVQVIYGAILEHVAWTQTSPAGLAEQLLGTMLPHAPRRRRGMILARRNTGDRGERLGMIATEVPGKNILVIEDDPVARETLVTILTAEGYTAEGSANGREALNYLQRSPAPQLILLDLMMPVMNGWEFRHQQRQDRKLATIPVVVCSAADNIQQETALVGANEYLQKPIDLERLLDTVRHYCS
jgi:CheY-like chemotaxis protein